MFSGKMKTVGQKTDHWAPATGSQTIEVDYKGLSGNLEDNGNVLYIDYDISHIILFICQSS